MKNSPLFYLALAFSLVCFLLGLWQWQRFTWKEEHLAAIAHKCEAGAFRALPVVGAWRATDIDPWLWRRVKFQGRLEAARAKVWQSGRYHQLGLVRLASGGAILVEQPDPLQANQSSFEGVLYPTQTRRFFDVKDDRDKGLYYVLDVAKIAQRLSSTAGTKVFPLLAKLTLTCPTLSNRHFGYMLTFWLLMIFFPFLVIFGKKEQ